MPRKLHILITAGPTREPIDRVRFISNRSSGKLGVALADAATEAGHEVTLLLGPVDQTVRPAQDVRTYRFESSSHLKQLLETHFRDCDVLIMAAAVADYRPANVVDGKMPSDKTSGMTLQLQPTPDLVAMCAALKRPSQRIIAFALEEPEHLEQRAHAKLQRKGVDAIIANPLGTMESDAITARWLDTKGGDHTPGRLGKVEFSCWLIETIQQFMPHQ